MRPPPGGGPSDYCYVRPILTENDDRPYSIVPRVPTKYTERDGSERSTTDQEKRSMSVLCFKFPDMAEFSLSPTKAIALIDAAQCDDGFRAAVQAAARKALEARGMNPNKAGNGRLDWDF